MAEVIRYVDTDVVGGAGNGTSWANAYATLAACETAQQTDLDAAGNWMHIYVRASAGTADVAYAFFQGWTTSPTSYILIEAADTDRASAYGYSTAKYRFTRSTDVGVLLGEEYMRLDGVQFGVTSTATQGTGVSATALGAANDIRISNCYFKELARGAANTQGILVNDADALVTIWNCIAVGLHQGMTSNTGNTTNIYNCTYYGNVYGIRWVAGTVTATNCALCNNTDDILGTVTADYCASDDNDGTNVVAESGGGAAWPSDFTSAATGDFTLVAGSGLIDTGLNDPASGLFDDCIEGWPRAEWDVGAYELAATSSETIAETSSVTTAVYGNSLITA